MTISTLAGGLIAALVTTGMMLVAWILYCAGYNAGWSAHERERGPDRRPQLPRAFSPTDV